MMRRIVTAREQVEMLSPWSRLAKHRQAMLLPWRNARKFSSAPITLYRGVRVNLPPELVAEMKEKLADPRSAVEAGRELELGPKILEHLSSNPWETAIRGGHAPWTGLGPNWHPNPKKAHEAAYGYYDAAQQGTPWSDGVRADWPLMITAEVDHSGEVDPRTDHLAGEVHFPQGHPLKITSLVLQPEISPDGTLKRRPAIGGGATSVELLHNPIYERHGIHPGGPRQFMASAFDPMAVTKKLENEFRDWFVNLPEDRYQEINNHPIHPLMDGHPLGHWRSIEQFLKDKYPAAHRGFLNGQEDAAHWLDDPDDENASPMLENEDDWPEPYSSEGHQQLGYDPQEIVAGMVLLHNRAHSGRQDSYLNTDKKRLVDIYQKRQQMQRDYEQRQVST